LQKYRREVERLVKSVPHKRGPGKKRVGSQTRHSQWLAGYQVCGWSQHAIARAARIDQAAVNRDLHRLARAIGLTMRGANENDRQWTAARIRPLFVMT